jgi:cytochrome c oxidase cbb3-type subunit 1
MIVGLSFYGMSTFEGPMMSIKTVNALSHYTEWTIGHVHSGALGWVGMMTMGSIYCLLPRLYNKDSMYSTKLIDLHFWTATIGVVLYAVSLWVAGIGEGLMSRAVNADGTLTYAFIEILASKYPYYAMRLLGGAVYFFGMCVMAYNVFRTISKEKPVPVAVMEPA